MLPSTMKLLVGGTSAIALFSLTPDMTGTLKFLSGVNSTASIMSIASDSTIYPCKEDHPALGPFFAVGAQSEYKPSVEMYQFFENDPSLPQTSFVRSYWIDTSNVQYFDQTKFNNWLEVGDPTYVLILSNGKAIAVSDGDGTLKFFGVDEWGKISGPIATVKLPKYSTEVAEPGQLLELDDRLFIIEPKSQRVYHFQIPWDPLTLATKQELSPPFNYYAFPKHTPSRVTVNRRSGQLYVLTEDLHVFEIKPQEGNKDFSEPFFDILSTHDTPDYRAKMTAKDKITGGDIVWTKIGIVVSTVGAKKVDAELKGDLITILPVDPHIQKEQFKVYVSLWEALATMSLSPDGEYLMVGSRSSSIVIGHSLSKLQLDPNGIHVALTRLPKGFNVQSLAWIEDCGSEKR